MALSVYQIRRMFVWIAMPLTLVACGPEPAQVAAQCQMKTLQSYPNKMFWDDADRIQTQNEKINFAYACMQAAGFEPKTMDDPACWIGEGVNIRSECFKRM